MSKTVQQKQFEPLQVSLKMSQDIPIDDDFESEMDAFGETLADELLELMEKASTKFKGV